MPGHGHHDDDLHDEREGSGAADQSDGSGSHAGSPRNKNRPTCECVRYDPIRGGDRKSTRLNSSHSQISYAVFCLKKKKKLNLSYLLHRTIIYEIAICNTSTI